MIRWAPTGPPSRPSRSTAPARRNTPTLCMRRGRHRFESGCVSTECGARCDLCDTEHVTKRTSIPPSSFNRARSKPHTGPYKRRARESPKPRPSKARHPQIRHFWKSFARISLDRIQKSAHLLCFKITALTSAQVRL